jgi:hypothetical protein
MYQVRIAVENMYPWCVRGREALAYLPHWDPLDQDYDDVTRDFSHAAIAGANSVESIKALGDRDARLRSAAPEPAAGGCAPALRRARDARERGLKLKDESTGGRLRGNGGNPLQTTGAGADIRMSVPSLAPSMRYFLS